MIHWKKSCPNFTCCECLGYLQYTGSFIAHWLDVLLYYQAPMWVFALCYTAFGMVVVFSWVWVKPRPFHKPANRHTR